ncbi:MAG: transketolase family protein [Clostridiales bacterium]|nr:transketolase family protein [Clostridiales bacterium]
MSSREMREVFSTSLKQMMEQDKRIVLVDADLAKASGTTGIHAEFSERAMDCGVAEANMVSIAAGLASYGYIPYITTFAPFATRRVCDQLAISVCYARQNVKIVGTDPGIAAELNGGTHMGLEDIGVIRSLVGMVIFEPVDAIQLEKAMPVIRDYEGPVYIRLFRKALPDVFDASYTFDLFKADTIKEGRDVTIFASGIMVQESVEALALLREAGIDAELINIHTIKPIDRESVVRSAEKTGCVVTAENHSTIGGLYSAVAEVLSAECPTVMTAIGMDNAFGEVGKIPYLKQRYRMTKEDIVGACREVIAKKKK